MKLTSCIERLEAAGLLISFEGASDITIDRLTADSREVGPTYGFVAICGASTDGHLFIDKAVSNGATAIVCEAERMDRMSIRSAGAREPVLIRVTDSRRAWVELASLAHDDPGTGLTMSAVTGTNGKTTIATLLQRVLHQSGRTCGFIGTTGVFDGATSHEATHTTPSPDHFHAHLRAMLTNGCSHVSIEASSHAIDQHRLRLRDVDLAIFSNLSRDHLDYHGSEANYYAAKKALFDALSNDAVAITNLDDPYGKRILSDCAARHVTVATPGRNADIAWRITDESLGGLEIELDGDRRRYRLAGAYNAFNLTAVYAAARELGLGRNEALELLADCPPVRGRFEQIRAVDGRTIIIDYAHTPDALENVLRTVRSSLASGAELWCLFGCGGDRDRGKRPEMGRIAETLADRVVVTSDNPRSEDPIAILNDIRTGMSAPQEAVWLADRREAIEHAANAMTSNDTLILAGKGHETTQTLSSTTIHFDDREEARHAFGLHDPDTHAD